MGFLSGDNFNRVDKHLGFIVKGLGGGDSQGVGSRRKIQIDKISLWSHIAVVISSRPIFNNTIYFDADVLVVCIFKFQCPQISFILFFLCIGGDKQYRSHHHTDQHGPENQLG